MLKENAQLVLDYVRKNDGKNITAQMISDAIGVSKKSVDGIITSAFQKKGFMIRTDAEIENPDGTHSKVKFISLTAEGKAHDFNAD